MGRELGVWLILAGDQARARMGKGSLAPAGFQVHGYARKPRRRAVDVLGTKAKGAGAHSLSCNTSPSLGKGPLG